MPDWHMRHVRCQDVTSGRIAVYSRHLLQVPFRPCLCLLKKSPFWRSLTLEGSASISDHNRVIYSCTSSPNISGSNWSRMRNISQAVPIHIANKSLQYQSSTYCQSYDMVHFPHDCIFNPSFFVIIRPICFATDSESKCSHPPLSCLKSPR